MMIKTWCLQHRIALKQLKTKCEEYIISELSSSNSNLVIIEDLLKLAKESNAERLMTKLFEYIYKNNNNDDRS